MGLFFHAGGKCGQNWNKTKPWSHLWVVMCSFNWSRRHTCHIWFNMQLGAWCVRGHTTTLYLTNVGANIYQSITFLWHKLSFYWRILSICRPVSRRISIVFIVGVYIETGLRQLLHRREANIILQLSKQSFYFYAGYSNYLNSFENMYSST